MLVWCNWVQEVLCLSGAFRQLVAETKKEPSLNRVLSWNIVVDRGRFGIAAPAATPKATVNPLGRGGQWGGTTGMRGVTQGHIDSGPHSPAIGGMAKSVPAENDPPR
ncbi:hypothetical protein SKAU_G00161490 [Synaphobranchus kaupii]|uniref:Uncharacterized protein n=1 Tax=Synaphobranchus kaupii TaxID=118154 RepID=A0A9Q1IXP9_SYNKA|nr:hypothetical protein SKAU_G00161490 [Synaphobranchus kaupii]